jgi:hypothetical protein
MLRRAVFRIDKSDLMKKLVIKLKNRRRSITIFNKLGIANFNPSEFEL